MNSSSKKTIMALIKTIATAVFAFSLGSCGSSADSVKVPKVDGFQQSHGPFDEDGNYIEKWADSPPKRRYTSKKPGRSITTVKPKTKAKVAPPKKVTPPKRTYTPPKQTYTPPKTTYTPPKKKYTTQKKTYTPPKKTTKVAPKKVKPKPTPKKVKPKRITPKAKAPIVHRVVKGDTLYGLSRKYGASVSDIQTANGLKGSSISLGANLIIPRK